MTVGSGRISAAGRGDPLEVAWAGLGQFPAEVLLELMVGSAQTAKVAGAGPAACAAVGNRVVEIAPPHGLSASREPAGDVPDRKSTRLNCRHLVISYAVFCLKTNIQLGAIQTTAATPHASHDPARARPHRPACGTSFRPKPQL